MEEKRDIGKAVNEIGNIHYFVYIPGSFIHYTKNQEYKNKFNKVIAKTGAYTAEIIRLGMYGFFAYEINNLPK